MKSLPFVLVALACATCGGRVDVDAGTPDAAGDVSPQCLLQPAKYSLVCFSASDCVGVFFGDVCSNCLCPNAAIASSAHAQYEADLAATNHTPQNCFCPKTPPVSCCAGACTMGTCDGGP